MLKIDNQPVLTRQHQKYYDSAFKHGYKMGATTWGLAKEAHDKYRNNLQRKAFEEGYDYYLFIRGTEN